jgi:hypothetical protein
LAREDRSALVAVGRIPQSSGRRRLSTDPSRLDRLVEMVAPNAPLLADLVGLKLTPSDPLPNRLLLDLEQRSGADKAVSVRMEGSGDSIAAAFRPMRRCMLGPVSVSRDA